MLHGIDRMFDHDRDGKLNAAEWVARNAYFERMLAQDEAEEQNTYGADEAEDEDLDFGLNESNDDEDEYDENDGSFGYDSDYDSEDFGGDDYNSDFGEDF